MKSNFISQHMITEKLICSLTVFFLVVNGYAQTQQYFVNDILEPDLKGQVKSINEFIISGNDTLRSMYVSYSRAGFRDTLYIQSAHPELGFKNDSACYIKKGNEITAVDCKTNAAKDTKISIDKNGLINEMDITYPNQTISLFPEYDSARRLTAINTAKSDKKAFQFIATLDYTYNSNGCIQESEAEGGDQPQGKTIYTYDNKNQLIKTVRSGFDGDKSFTIEYIAHDEKQNWTSAQFQNGIILNRVIAYY